MDPVSRAAFDIAMAKTSMSDLTSKEWIDFRIRNAWKKRLQPPILCECGHTYSYHGKTSHLTTVKHRMGVGIPVARQRRRRM